MRWFFVLMVACRSAQPVAPLPEEEDAPPRVKMYFRPQDGDTKAAMERARTNAVGCKREERSNGTKLWCPGVDLWLVPEDSGIEITCAGQPIQCSKQVEALLK